MVCVCLFIFGCTGFVAACELSLFAASGSYSLLLFEAPLCCSLKLLFEAVLQLLLAVTSLVQHRL